MERAARLCGAQSQPRFTGHPPAPSRSFTSRCVHPNFDSGVNQERFLDGPQVLRLNAGVLVGLLCALHGLIFFFKAARGEVEAPWQQTDRRCRVGALMSRALRPLMLRACVSPERWRGQRLRRPFKLRTLVSVLSSPPGCSGSQDNHL